MSPWKRWSWMKSNSKTRPSTVFLFYYASIFIIIQPLGSGYHEIKVNELPADWAWTDGTKAANWGSRKGYLCECFFFFPVIHLTFKHTPWKESTIKRFVDDLELLDDQLRKSARIIWFLSSPWSGFRQLSTACKRDDLSKNYGGILSVPKFEKLQFSFTTDLYHRESCLIKLALETLNRRQQLLDREANTKVIC